MSDLQGRSLTPVEQAAYEFVESMVPRADSKLSGSPRWHGWALREAFEAGAKWQATAGAQVGVKPGDCIHCGKEICNDFGWCNSFETAPSARSCDPSPDPNAAPDVDLLDASRWRWVRDHWDELSSMYWPTRTPGQKTAYAAPNDAAKLTAYVDEQIAADGVARPDGQPKPLSHAHDRKEGP